MSLPARRDLPPPTREQVIAAWRRGLAEGTVSPREVFLAVNTCGQPPQHVAAALRDCAWPTGGRQ